MYICQVTGKKSNRGDKLNKLVVQTRDRVYFKREKNEETGRWEDKEIGKGWEIVREINVSQEGMDLWNSWTPEERSIFLENMDS